MTVKGHVENNVVIFDEDVTLADGTNVVISIERRHTDGEKAFMDFLQSHEIVIPKKYRFNREELHER